MSKRITIIIIVLLIADLALMAIGIMHYQKANATLADLETRTDGIEERIVGNTMHIILTEPKNIFVMLEDHPEWEEVDAVPYSKCYRHLIGDATSTADYIVCTAI